ncbi:calcium/calmodulin-dependent protein kinase cmkA-like [Actinia tenebrosa]|uniref:Calcium/calmodulin-dependent protein kinase cmkA-like n=1 Tax=Actinia tenebrosa TaxID=6105 RepID=A0A6P8IP78_ACTTE|nr:calcium/calmodulin-dependent protein kinase cmkA-like [Actinia tenebrosa]
MEGTLDEYFESPRFDLKDSVQLCQDVLQGLNFLHLHNILHRDLKPSNILYKWYPKLCLKIADFGLSCLIEYNSTTVFGTTAGRRYWIAPEVLVKDRHSKASDMYSCGLLLHYILSANKHLFSLKDGANKDELQFGDETETNLLHGYFKGRDYSLSPEGANLVVQLLKYEARNRPTAAESLAHSLFCTLTKK